MNELSCTETAVITQAGGRQERTDGRTDQPHEQDGRKLQTSWKPVVPDQQLRKCSFQTPA